MVDVQNDFCPGGSLPVPKGDEVIPVLNRCIKAFTENGLPIVASRDWHPPRTKHFAKFGGTWPIHCVEGTKGAQFHPRLNLPEDVIILSKGMNPEEDAYSAFQAVDTQGKGLGRLLKDRNVSTLYVGGLATDYCVKSSVLDALHLGLEVYVIEDGVRGVNLKPDDSKMALREMRSKGARITNSHEILKTILQDTP